jgi:signal transduction histidine kinase/CheY-like chemotaxis protein
MRKRETDLSHLLDNRNSKLINSELTTISKDSTPEQVAAINEALLISSLRQHELTDEAEKLNVQLQGEIAERKKTETALSEAIDDLKRAQGNTERASRAKDDFLAILSHELRTPLTPALLATTALMEDKRLPSDVHEQLIMIERNIALEARLIDDLLDLTAIAHGKLQIHARLCDAHSLITLAIAIVHVEARAKEIVIEHRFVAEHSGLLTDPARFQQVIWNLLRNAIKFTTRGGKISISTRDEKSTPDTTWLHIEITDSGIGIAPALLETIFLPFDQGILMGAHRFGGVGLGLAIARAVMDLHGGRINARSAGLGCGATFIVEFPGAVIPPDKIVNVIAEQPVAALAIVPPVFIGLRLLVVEDNENTIQALSLLLKKDGHQVVSATTVAEALAAAAREKFDLVISDIGLPDGSGTALMTKLRDTYGLGGIALSGYGMEEDFVRSRAAGFVTHLVKPVTIADLRRSIAVFSH